MKNVIIWNDFTIDESYSKDIDNELREKLNKRFGQCDCKYLGMAETKKWKNQHINASGIAVGSRPKKIWSELPNLSIHRVFDKERHILDYHIDCIEKEVIDAFSKQEIAFYEDCIVKGDTIRKIIEMIPNSKNKQVTIVAMMCVKSNVIQLQKEHPFLNFDVEYLLDGKTDDVWDCTVLFLSDLLSDKEMLINDERRMVQCFYEDYENIKEYLLSNKERICTIKESNE